MATAVIMPKFEMAQETGTVARWLKNEGDTVAKGEPLLEVETDKVIMEVEAPATGTLVNVSAPAGVEVPIGQPIAFIARSGEQVPAPAAPVAATALPAAPGCAPAAAAPAAPKVAPSVVTNANHRATPLAERVASEHGLELGSITGTGPQGRITREDVEQALAALAVANATTPSPEPRWPDGKVRAVPAARRLARELSVDLLAVPGSGPEGRIQPADVLAVAQRAVAAQAQASIPTAIGSAAPALEAREPASPAAPSGLAVRRTVPLTSIRRTIAERMTASVRDAPQFAVSSEAEMARAQTMVEDVKSVGEGKEGPKVTLTAFLVKACAWALAAYPAANSAFDAAAGALVEWAEINVGVAVATDSGLLVPVIHGADRLGLVEIAARLGEITVRARAGKLRLEDIQGGTFTVSNLGMLGIDQFTAILNPPQAAILAVGRVAKRPVIDENDQVVVRALSSLTLTADHRVLDGAGAAQFLALIKKALEHPGLLLR
jgi:pyruvate dehydrogenase E2 component (dihydrolipoamide acetyltransferase)